MKRSIKPRTTIARFSSALQAAIVMSTGLGVALDSLREPSSTRSAAACPQLHQDLMDTQLMELRVPLAHEPAAPSCAIAEVAPGAGATLHVALQRYEPTSWLLR